MNTLNEKEQTAVILPDLRIIPIDDTRDWNDECQQIAGRLASVYLVDLSVQHYLCSLTTAYELVYVGFITEKFLTDDQDEMIRNGIYSQDDLDMYLEKADRLKSIKYIGGYVEDEFPGYDNKEDYREWFSDQVEYLQCNGYEDLACMKLLDFKASNYDS